MFFQVYDSKDYRQAVDGYLRVAEHPNINGVVNVINSSDKAYVFFYSGVRMSQKQPEECSGNQPGNSLISL